MKKRSVVSVKGLVGALALALVVATPVFAFEVGDCIVPLARQPEAGDEQCAMGQAYSEGVCGFQKDMKQAVSLYRKAAEQGNTVCQYKLGAAYYEGEGVSKNMQEAAKWFRKAAEKNDADAEWSLGMMYIRGEGVPKDFELGLEWVRRAAEHGNEQANKLLEEHGLK